MAGLRVEGGARRVVEELLVADGVPVPSGLRHERFVATPLTVVNAALDHAAYVASPDVILTHSDGRWPVAGFTLADDLELVAGHEDDHRAGRAFTFVLLAPSEAEALGCLYVNPLRAYLRRAGAAGHVVDATPTDAAMVTFWLRQDQEDTGLADVVVEAVRDWIRREWPLSGSWFRVLPGELTSCAALERSGLARAEVSHPGDPRPYRWFRIHSTHR